MRLPLFLLSFASIFIGYFARDLFIGLGTSFWDNSLFTLPSKQYLLETEWLDTEIKIIPLIFSLSGTGLSLVNYLFHFNKLFALKINPIGRSFYTFLNRKWFFDKIYNENISQFFFKISYRNIYQNIDRGILEFFGPYGLSIQIYKYSKDFFSISLNSIYHYLFLSLGFIIFFIFFYGVFSTLVINVIFLWLNVEQFIVLFSVFLILFFFKDTFLKH